MVTKHSHRSLFDLLDVILRDIDKGFSKENIARIELRVEAQSMRCQEQPTREDHRVREGTTEAFYVLLVG